MNTGIKTEFSKASKLESSNLHSEMDVGYSPLLDLPAGTPPAPLEAFSFRTRMQRPQRQILNLSLITLGVAGSLQPVLLAVAVSWALFCLFSVLVLSRLLLILVGVAERSFPARHVRAPPGDVDLPMVSVLVAAYREATMMAQLAAALRRISWPRSKLEILILLEADDRETQRAAEKAAFESGTRILIVPPGGPRTKPNALNHGLASARGAIVTVYDVEDIPHPDQIRAAYQAFRRAPPNTVCVQAPLIADNANANWIASHWALEYDVQFGLLLPGLSVYRMPLLLGGTSNHFRREALLAMGGWDAWNVTEDADLGMRLARLGGLTQTIRTPTREIAPTQFHVWLAQRSRWLKGFMQTWLVLMRRPRETMRQLGLIRFAIVQLTLGGAIITPLAHAPFAVLTLFSIVSGHLAVGHFGLGLLIAGLLIGALGDLFAPGPWSWRRGVAILTRAAYWPLHSLAAYRALWELADKPFFWAKTPHQPRDVEPASSCSTGS